MKLRSRSRSLPGSSNLFGWSRLGRAERRRVVGFALLALLLVFAQFIASAHRIVHADHEASVPGGHNCLVFDAVLGGTAPPAAAGVLALPVELPSVPADVVDIVAVDSARPWASFRPRDPPVVRVS